MPDKRGITPPAKKKNIKRTTQKKTNPTFVFFYEKIDAMGLLLDIASAVNMTVYLTPMQGEFIVAHHSQSAQIVFYALDGNEHLFEIYWNAVTETVIFDHFIPVTDDPQTSPTLHRYTVEAEGFLTLARIFEHCGLSHCLLQWLPHHIYENYDHDLDVVMNTTIDSLDAEKFVMYESAKEELTG